MNVTIKDLFKAGVHFGHMTRFRNPTMDEYIYTTNNKVCIINLDKTLPMLNDGLKFIRKIAARGGKVMFVGTKRSAGEAIKEAAVRADMPYVNHRWLGGMLTNYKTIRQSIRRLNTLQKMQAEDGFDGFTKKEKLNLERELDKLQASLGGIQNMGGLPDALFIIDVGYQDIAVKEANRLRIPIVGIVDTNSNPFGVDYPVPGNDDSMRAISLYANLVADTILEVQKEQKNKAQSKMQDDFVEVTASSLADDNEEI